MFLDPLSCGHFVFLDKDDIYLLEFPLVFKCRGEGIIA